jgi:tetratricopeptide (TPR) repeat protein
VIELLIQAEGALSVGLLDRAETLYRQVASADPRNAIAIVGLSRVALERGQQQEALELARRALALDRENVAAQRMVQRLEEVLAFRGEGFPGSGTTEPTSRSSPAPASDGPSGPSTPGAPSPQSLPDAARPRRSLLDRLRGRR